MQIIYDQRHSFRPKSIAFNFQKQKRAPKMDYTSSVRHQIQLKRCVFMAKFSFYFIVANEIDPI